MPFEESFVVDKEITLDLLMFLLPRVVLLLELFQSQESQRVPSSYPSKIGNEALEMGGIDVRAKANDKTKLGVRQTL